MRGSEAQVKIVLSPPAMIPPHPTFTTPHVPMFVGKWCITPDAALSRKDSDSKHMCGYYNKQ